MTSDVDQRGRGGGARRVPERGNGGNRHRSTSSSWSRAHGRHDARTTLRAVTDTGLHRGDTIRGRYAQAPEAFDDLPATGVDIDDVVAALEADGVQNFPTSRAELLDSVWMAMQARW